MDDGIHVVIPVFAQTAAENNIFLLSRKLPVALIQRRIAFIIDGIIGLLPGLPRCAELAADDGTGLGAELEVLVFDDASPRSFRIREIHGGNTLIVGHVQHLRLKMHRPILQLSQTVVEIAVDRTRVNHPASLTIPPVPVLQIVHPGHDLDTLQHRGHHAGVSALRDTLMSRIEIVGVVIEADGEPTDDESGKLLTAPPPLLFGIAPDELLVDIRPDKADGLFLQIGRLGDAALLSLFGNFGRCFLHAASALGGTDVLYALAVQRSSMKIERA